MNPPQGPDETGTNVEARHFSYTAMIPPVPLPHGYTSDPQGEAYPLQSEMPQSHRMLHTHIFKEVMSLPESGRPSRLMVTEVDRYGVERNRQPELVMCAPMMVETSIVGIKPLDLPITGVGTTTFPKHMVKTLLGLPRGKTTSDRLTMLTMRLDHMRNSQNLTWMMLHLSLPRQAMCRFQVRSTVRGSKLVALWKEHCSNRLIPRDVSYKRSKL
jgi:hypothetical protein